MAELMSKRRLFSVSILAVIAVVVMASVGYVYTSPIYSWDPNVRDHDGDGTADEKDLFPKSPLYWSNASATLTITIVNNFSRDLEYDLYCYSHNDIDESRRSGSVPKGKSIVQTIVFQWATGKVNTTTANLYLFCHYYDNGVYISPNATTIIPAPFELTPGEARSVAFTITSAEDSRRA